MNIHHNNRLYKDALDHKASPSPKAWNSIREKIDQDKKIVRMSYTKYMWIAAAMVTVLGVLTIFKTEVFKTSTQDNNATTQIYTEQIETLSSNYELGIYEMQKLAGLKMAYRKLNEKSGM